MAPFYRFLWGSRVSQTVLFGYIWLLVVEKAGMPAVVDAVTC